MRYFLSLVLCCSWASTAVSQQLDGPPCKIGDPSVERYRELSESQQVAFARSYSTNFEPVLEEAEATLRTIVKSTPFQVVGRVKSSTDIREKALRAGKNYSCFSQITDIAGLRVVVPDYAALPYLISSIRQSFDVREESYRINNDIERPGYRAIHYLVSVDGRLAEIQIHTLRGTLWANASHVLFYKGPYAQDAILEDYLWKLSEAVYHLDSGLYAVLPAVPETLAEPVQLILDHVLDQMVLIGRPDPMKPFFVMPAREENLEAFKRQVNVEPSPQDAGSVPSVEPATVRLLVREVFERAGFELELIELASFADHFALDEFGDLRYQLQLEAVTTK